MSVELDPAIAAVAEMVPFPAIGADTLPLMRGPGIFQTPDLSDQVVRMDHVVDAATGVSVRVHRPVGLDGPLPCIYGIHGGGYVLGSNDMQDGQFDVICRQLGVVAVSVEYRLSPELPYPGPLEDCYAGLRWTFEHAGELGVDTSNVGILGTSAGGGLCAGLALLVRDRGEYNLTFQLLDCPMIDDRQVTASSQLDGLLIWSKESNTFGWTSYLGDLYGTDDVPGYAAPARATDLTGLPPAYVCVGGADGFRDEDIAYATRLMQAGVATELHVYPGAPHGVAMFQDAEVARRYSSDQLDWLRRRFPAK